MRPWLTGLDAYSGAHEVERKLRHGLRWHIEELVQWLPSQWRPALRWLGWLPYLEIFAYLRRHGEVYPWMREDMVLFPYLSSSQGHSQQSDERAVFQALPGTWLAGWYLRLPSGVRGQRTVRERLGPALLEAAGLLDESALAGASEPQRRLHSLFLHQFHGHCTTALAAFAYLGLILLELRALRAELQGRVLFPVQGVAS